MYYFIYIIVSMFVATIPNRKSPPAILVRESYRENGKVKTRTLSNLSHLPKYIIDLIRRSLKGEKFLSIDDDFERVESWHHGHVDAVHRAMKRLGFECLINARRCKERDLVVAMVMGRILEPDNEKNSKLANTRWWDTTTLPSMLNLDGVDEDDLYEAMDWLLKRQERIEKKLAHQHLTEGGMVLYDLTSSYFEGVTCPLAALGHDRDGKKGKLQVNYGLLTDDQGCPVAVSVFPGNTSDSKTVTCQTQKMRERFGIQTMVLVGDRGMITQKLIDEDLRQLPGVDWITALRSGTIQKLVKTGQVQLGLFDEVNLFEITASAYPGERLVVCRNPELAKLRARKRQALLDATIDKLKEVRCTVEGGKLRGKDKIGKRLENIVKKYKVANQFAFTVRDDEFDVKIDDKQRAAGAALDGVFKELQNTRSRIKRGKLSGKTKIRQRINKIVTKYNLTKYVVVDIRQADFDVRFEDSNRAAEAALASVCKAIEAIRFLVKRGKYGGQDKIGVRVGKVVNKYKVAKHFVLNIQHDGFDFIIAQEKVATEAALDGIYVIRTSLPIKRLSPEDTVRSYKSLSQVERAFRSIKTVDLKVRPIRHHLEKRVQAHIFLCMLAYYVEWHMREVWRPLLFTDEDKERKKTSDPVAPANRSDAALQKVRSKRLDDGTVVHSFQTLLKLMSQIVRNKCRISDAGSDEPTFEIVTTPSEKQQRAYNLIDNITL
jgi:transposase